MLHWISDLPINAGSGGGGGHEWDLWVTMHFLRTMGWNIRGETDYSIHVYDGSMDADNVTYWTAVGTATRAKNTSQVYAGYRSLTFTTLATGDGVQSAIFASMEASTTFALGLAAWNNCGHALTVYIDTGTGAWTLLGTIPDNGGAWTNYRWTYITHSAVSTCKVKIVDEAGTVDAGEVYLDSIYTARSAWWENSDTGRGTDGVIESGNNKFSSASYNFTDADITAGRWVVFYDPTNLGNSGVYTVTGRDGTKAVLGIRAGVGEYLTAATGLSFRVIDKANFHYVSVYNSSTSGICLESPHATKWRWKVRLYWAHWGSGAYSCYGQVASAPGACGLNVDTFGFYKDSESTVRNHADDNSISTVYGWGVGQRGSGTSHRFTLVTDGETFVLGIDRAVAAAYHSAFFMGFLGDTTLPLENTFAHIMRRGIVSDTSNELRFDYTVVSWSYAATTFGLSGLGLKSCIASAGYGSGATVPEAMTNAKANPFSGEEVVRPVMVFGDWDNVYGEFQVIESTNEAFGHCRQNLTAWTPFGASLEWQHMYAGLCIAWHGRQVTP